MNAPDLKIPKHAKNDGYHEDKLSLVLQNSETHYDALQSEPHSDKIGSTGKLYEIMITPGTKHYAPICQL